MRTLLVSLLIVGLVMATSAPAQDFPRNTWGLSIGIADYNPVTLSLKWADKDAIEFSTFLRYGLGLPEDQYRLLKNREATRENIRDALGWLSLVATPEDRVYIFYSGHGKDNSPIVPHNVDNLLSLEMIKSALNKIDAGEVIFFADACYSGKLAGKNAKVAIERQNFTGLSQSLITEIAEAQTGTVVISSANGIQESYEWDGQKNGVFTYHLMNTLMDQSTHSTIDRDNNGEITVYEIYHHVSELVSNESQQAPQISNPERAKKIVMFSPSEDSSPVAESEPTVVLGPAPETQKGMSSGVKTAIGVGAAVALGGGIALALSGGGGGDGENAPNPTPTPSPDDVEAVLFISPSILTTCGSATNQLFVSNRGDEPLVIERIDYEESLILDEPPTTCRQGRRGSFLPDVTFIPPNRSSLVREWNDEFYPCSSCPYRFEQCNYIMNYSVQTSAGTVEAAPPAIFIVSNEEGFCPGSGTFPPGP